MTSSSPGGCGAGGSAGPVHSRRPRRSATGARAAWHAAASIPSGTATTMTIAKDPRRSAARQSSRFPSSPSRASVSAATMPGRSAPMAVMASSRTARTLVHGHAPRGRVASRPYTAAMPTPDRDAIVLADNLTVMAGIAEGTFQLIYMDPPFNRGGERRRLTLATEADPNGQRVGFGGRRYRSRLLAEAAYRDGFEDYLGFLEPRLREARRLLRRSGTLDFHIDHRAAHYCKLLLDEVLGRGCFLNEIGGAYDFGGRPRGRWPA